MKELSRSSHCRGSRHRSLGIGSTFLVCSSLIGVSILGGAPTSFAQPAAITGVPTVPQSASPTSSTEEDPHDPWLDTDSCPFKVNTPPAVDTSEVPLPGQSTPTPLPLPEDSPGGDKLQTCGIIADGIKLPSSPENISTGSWLLYDINSGDVLAAKDPFGRYRPASVIKTLLALVVLERLPMQQVIPVSDAAQNVEGSAVGIGKGGRYTTDQLLHGLMLQSGNDTAVALAEAMGGEKVTIDLMQQKALSLGTTGTRITTVHGLDAPGTQTTAYDLSLIYQAAFKNPAYVRLVSTESLPFPGYGDLPGYEIGNDNQLLYNYPGTIGGKTGYTTDARHSFAAAVERNGRTLGIVMLNGTNAAGPLWTQAQRVFDAAFQSPQAKPVGYLENITHTASTPSAENSTDPRQEAQNSAENSDSELESASSDSSAEEGFYLKAEDIFPLIIVGIAFLFGVVMLGYSIFHNPRRISSGRARLPQPRSSLPRQSPSRRQNSARKPRPQDRPTSTRREP